MAVRKDSRMTLVYNSVYAIIGGFGLDALSSVFTDDTTGLTKLLKCAGVLGITYYAWTWSKFDRIFRNLGLGIDTMYPIQKGVKKYENSVVYKFTLPTGLSTDTIENKKTEIEQWLGKKISIEYINHGLFIIEVFNDTSATMYDYDGSIKVNGDIAFPVGYDLHQKLVTCCLSNGDDNAHMLIAGTSGGGKSILLKVILTYLITNKHIDMYLIDLKGTELSIFENCDCVREICYDPENVLSLLDKISSIMKKRYDTFRKDGVRDIQSYNKKHTKGKMKYIVLAIDEYSILMEDDESQNRLQKLSALSRASGISLIISTQRPDSKVIDSRIKCNFSVIAGLRTNTAINSRIIFDDDSLSSLRGKGHCMFKYGGFDHELQGMFISDNLIENLIKPFEVDKSKDNVIPMPVKEEKVKFDFSDMEVFIK